MIADAHTHIFPPRIVNERTLFFEKENAFKLLYENPRSRLIDADVLIESMDKAGIGLSVTFGFPWESLDLCKAGNDYVIEESIKHPDRLAPFITLPCCSIDAAMTELARCSKEKIAGIGELSFYCCDDQTKATKWQLEIGRAVAQLNLPLLWHVTEDVGHDYPGKGGMNPKEAVNLITNMPGQTIILAHWGGGLPFFELMPEVAKKCANIYYDTAASPYLYDQKIFEVATSVIGHDRILFGSDYPLLGQKRYIKQVQNSNITQEQADAILGGNLLRLLGRYFK